MDLNRVTLLTLLLSIFSGETSDGQILRGFGVQAGAVRSNRTLVETGGSALDLDPVWGWALGGSIEWRTWSDKLGLLSEIWLLEKGFARESFSGTSGTKDRYLSIPVLCDYQPWRCKLCPYLMVGPSLERFMSEDAQDSSKDVAWGVGINVGTRFRWSRYADARLRYAHDLVSSSGSGLAGVERVENWAIVLSVGVTFGIGPQSDPGLQEKGHAEPWHPWREGKFLAMESVLIPEL